MSRLKKFTMVEEKATFRVVTIGESSVGKTCIINRFLRNSFDVDEPNTIGALYDSFVQECNGRTIEVQLWDTAGQEQYRSLGPVYFRAAAAAIAVFDVANRDSFESLGDWVRAFRSVSGESTIVIVTGNKCDLERTVSVQEAKQWASENACKYVETSAKTGQGVKVLFDELISLLAALNCENLSDPAPQMQPRAETGARCC